MVEVFITNAREAAEAKFLLKTLQDLFRDLELNLDLDGTDRDFPCGHSVLRTEGDRVDAEALISAVEKAGFKCEVMEDKVC